MNALKGVILAGGSGTRLNPLTKLINKHLLPVGKHPMIHYSLEKMRSAGIKDILLITGKHSMGLFAEYLGNGNDWGVQITYRIQEEAGGIAQALALVENYIRPDEKFIVLLGDNLFEDSLSEYMQQFLSQEQGAKVLLKQVDNPHRYGVPVILDNRILHIEEKPLQPKSNSCVTGIYMYDAGVFDRIRENKPSYRGELEITDVNNMYASEGTLTYNILQGWWIDAGTFESLQEAGIKLFSND